MKKDIYSLEDLKKIKKDKLYKKYDLNLKKENFLNFSYENLKIDKNFLSNFIEKFSIWYELKYSDYDLKTYFQDNKLINELDNSLFYDKLNKKEKELISTPIYDKYNFVNGNIHFIHLDQTGIITNMGIYYEDYRKFIGHHIKEFYKILKFYKKEEYKEIEKIIKLYENKIKFNSLLFDNIMYRIIERGGATYGVERAYLFALNFKRNINLPLMYYENVGSINDATNFINNYLKNGGDKDIICCNGYFYKNITENPLNNYIEWLKKMIIGVNKSSKIIKFEKEK